MTFFRSLFGNNEERAVYASDVWGRWASGDDVDLSPGTHAGVTVSQDSALRMVAVYSCIRLLSEDVAGLPVGVFRREDGVRLPQPRPRWLARPNGEMTRFELFEMTMASLLTDGNAYTEIIRDRFQEPVELWPHHPSQVTPRRNDDGDLEFVIRNEDGTERVVPYFNMLHIRAFRLPGSLKGISPIEKARQAIGLGLAEQEFGARFFGQGANAGGVIQYPGDADDDAVKNFLKRWKKSHSGLKNAHVPGVLTGGATWQQITVAPEHAQFIESRKFAVTEIARLFRVPPHMIGDMERATFSNIEHQSLEYVQYSLRSWLERIEQVYNSLLVPGTFMKFNVEGILRGDIKTRYAALEIMRRNGALNADEWRALEDLPPIEGDGGHIYLQPVNYAPLGFIPNGAESPFIPESTDDPTSYPGATKESDDE